MPRLRPIDLQLAPGATRELLAGVHEQLGMVPKMIATMAHSEVVARAYVGLSEALSSGAIPPRLREQIALAVGQANDCVYCVAAHTAVGKSVGLTDDEVRDARAAKSPDRTTDAALRFARRIVDLRGAVSESDLAAVRAAGYGDATIVEIIAHVALNVFSNYFNRVAIPEVDFPAVADVGLA